MSSSVSILENQFNDTADDAEALPKNKRKWTIERSPKLTLTDPITHEVKSVQNLNQKFFNDFPLIENSDLVEDNCFYINADEKTDIAKEVCKFFNQKWEKMGKFRQIKSQSSNALRKRIESDEFEEEEYVPKIAKKEINRVIK
ncbi:hypothetical protein BpHYR1_048367 [Brachionus plicatilis]|uniref:Uncharacterized protein n=1 Tax=Brachionus plicatilis TaxID=10195 RepID=A0A3M7PZ15_BRAPC|nr:hypothetical protein BpHYR1_048367 [Brachionus plicatilis]